jgi:hypothetical protein
LVFPLASSNGELVRKMPSCYCMLLMQPYHFEIYQN